MSSTEKNEKSSEDLRTTLNNLLLEVKDKKGTILKLNSLRGNVFKSNNPYIKHLYNILVHHLYL